MQSRRNAGFVFMPTIFDLLLLLTFHVMNNEIEIGQNFCENDFRLFFFVIICMK